MGIQLFFRKDLLIFLISLFILGACKHADIDTLPGENPLGTLYTDSLNFSAGVVREDSIVGNISTSGNGLLGYFVDPTFGKSSAAIAFEVLPPRTIDSFGTGLELDSLVLLLAYGGYYGDTTSQFKIRVYELKQKLKDSVIYSDHVFKKSLNLLAEKTIKVKLRDSIIVNRIEGDTVKGTKKLHPHIRLQLDQEFGKRILGYTNFNAEEFSNRMNGFYVEVEPIMNVGKGGHIKVLLNTVRTSLNMFYKAKKNNKTTIQQFDFNTTQGSYKYNIFSKDYSGTAVAQALADTTGSLNNLYLDPNAGVNTTIDLKAIKNAFKNKKVSINSARLIVVAAPGANGTEGMPNSLLLRSKDSTGTLIDIAAATRVNGKYSFDLNIFLQDFLTSRIKTKELIIYPSNRFFAPEKLVLGGTKNLSAAPKFEIRYTEVK